MNDPKRYEAMGPEVIETPTGEFVLWQDYARLKAEVDKLTPKKPAFFTWTDKTFIDKVEFDKLQAENERLKDELGLMHQMFEKHLTPEIRKAIIKAAKGVQS